MICKYVFQEYAALMQNAACGKVLALCLKAVPLMTQPKLTTTFQSVFGAVVMALRSSRHPSVTQAQLAEFVGLTAPTWSRIERGESALVMDQMLGVAVFFEIPLSELIQRCEALSNDLLGQGIEVVSSRAELVDQKSVVILSNAQLQGMVGVSTAEQTVAAAPQLYKFWQTKTDQ